MSCWPSVQTTNHSQHPFKGESQRQRQNVHSGDGKDESLGPKREQNTTIAQFKRKLRQPLLPPPLYETR